MKKLIITILFSLFLCGSAYALPLGLNFDPDGDSTTSDEHEIYGFDLQILNSQDPDNPITVNTLDNYVTIVTHQYLDQGTAGVLDNGDEFEEDLWYSLVHGLNSTGTAAADATGDGAPDSLFLTKNYDLGMEVHLEGYIDNYVNGGVGDTTVTNVDGLATDKYDSIYTDGIAKFIDYTTNTVFATLKLTSADLFEFTGSDYGATADLHFEFVWIDPTIDYDYWPNNAQLSSLIGQGFVLALGKDEVQGVINGSDNIWAAADGNGDGDDDHLVLGFTAESGAILFNVVPEPTTILLFGIGLLGFASIGRKREI